MDKTQETSLEMLHKELGDVAELVTKTKEATDTQYRELTNSFGGAKADSDEIKAEVKKRAGEYAELVANFQALSQGLERVKREIDAPIFKGGKDLKESDTVAAIELQRRIHLSKNESDDNFRPDMDNLVQASDYRSAMRKFAKLGIETKASIFKSLNEIERKAFDAASMDSAFFMPEMLGIEVDCNIECAYMLDLYQHVNVSRSTFMYPQIVDYGALGAFGCDAGCDVELGPEGNITYKNGQTHSFRGMFCLQRNVLAEANYDIIGFIVRAAARSKRVNDNRVMISGSGVNEPKGWMTADCFPKLKTAPGMFDHQAYRRFISTAPVEYGDVIATMHQNVFAYLASALDFNQRFIFGDGQMGFSPSDTTARIRISNCLPDATAGNTRGNALSPFVANDFLVAAGNWQKAYAVADKRPLSFEPFVGGSGKWCAKWQFDAEIGGFTTCCPAARVLTVG